MGDVIAMLPFGTEQLGCVTVAVGTIGIAGAAFTIAVDGNEMQLLLFLTVTEYVLVETLLKIPFVLL